MNAVMTHRMLAVAIGLVIIFTAPNSHAQKSALVRDVENPDNFPYVEYGSTTLTSPYVNGFISFPTPLGSRYFIEQVAMSCSTPSNTDVFTQALLVTTKITGPTTSQGYALPVLVLEKRGPNVFGGYVWTGSALIKVSSDADAFSPDGGGGLMFNIFHTDTTVAPTCSATLVGHSHPLATP